MPKYIIPGKKSTTPPKPPPPPPPKPQVRQPAKPVSTAAEDRRLQALKPTTPPKKSTPPPPPPPPSQYRYVPSYATPEKAKEVSDANIAKAVRDLNSPNKQDRDTALKVLAPTRTTPPPPPPPKKKTPAPKVVSPPPVVEDIPEIIFDPPVYPTPPSSGGGSGRGSDTETTPPPPPIKSAPIDTVLFNDEQVSAEIIADLLFENIGGQEILSIARHDTVNGQDITYQPIKNLSAIQQQYSSETLVKIKSTSKDIFGNFPIDIQAKIPNVGNGPGGSNYYLDADGNIILEFINLEDGQEIEVQITSSGTIEGIGE